MSTVLADQLAAFQESDYSVRTVRGLLGVMPFVPDWKHPGTLEQAAARLDPALAPRLAARAEVIAKEPEIQAALRAFELLDKGDKGIAIFSGIKGVVQGVRGAAGALETDPQQAADAGLKAVGVAYAAYKLYPGTVQERIAALTSSDTGRALLTFYVAVDVVLPFADNLASGGVELMTGIVDKYAAENAARLVPVAGAEVEQAVGMLKQLSGTLGAYLGQAAAFAQPLSAWCQEKLPGVLGKADAISGVVATAVDTLETYKYLGAVLVTEHCLARALVDVRAELAVEAEQKRLAEEARRKEEEAARARAAAEEKARAERSKQREDYSLGEAESAASLSAAPIKYTRTTDVASTSGGAPEKKSGCMGCAGLLAVAILAGGIAPLAWAAF